MVPLTRAPDPGGAPQVVWVEARAGGADLAWGDHALISSNGIEDLCIAPWQPAGLAAGERVRLDPPWRRLQERPFERETGAVLAGMRRLAAAAAGTPDEALTVGLLRLALAQERSSPFETQAQRTELDAQACRSLSDAALADRPALYLRELWNALAALLVEKREIELLQEYVGPIAERWAPCTTTRIATNDARMLSAVKRYNKIWAVHTSALNPSWGFNIAVVHVIAINAPASTAVAPSINHNLHYHGGCTFDYYFAAVTVDGNGNMLMVFNRSSTGERPNVRFSGWHAASFPNQTTLIGGGGDFSSGRVGLAPGAFTETRGRWGDYSGISIDPVSPQQNVWVAGEILAGNNFWTTQIGKIFHSPVPSSP